MRRAQLVSVRILSARFRLIELEGDALRNVVWSPGQKIQVAMNASFSTRTYTPISWDAAAGRTHILAYAHGLGPGACWADEVRAGDTCQFFGPRPSLDFANVDKPFVLFGDETSLGLAAASQTLAQNLSADFIFETSDVNQIRSLLAEWELGKSHLIGRKLQDAHLDAVERVLCQFAETPAQFVLTGKATSIQHLHRYLKRIGISSRIKTKAY